MDYSVERRKFFIQKTTFFNWGCIADPRFFEYFVTKNSYLFAGNFYCFYQKIQ